MIVATFDINGKKYRYETDSETHKQFISILHYVFPPRTITVNEDNIIINYAKQKCIVTLEYDGLWESYDVARFIRREMEETQK